jgi:hypothetical protein
VNRPGEGETDGEKSINRDRGRMASLRLARLKRYGKWGITAVAIAFLLHSLRHHWQEVVALPIDASVLSLLLLSLGITLLAHLWSGWVWGWILHYLNQPIACEWSTLVYLRTNLWKYLPGNVWHFYGRVQALRSQAIPTGIAIVGVLLDPLLMAAAALLLGVASPTHYWGWPLAVLIAVLVAVHPQVLNPVVQRLSRSKIQSSQQQPPPQTTAIATTATSTGTEPLTTALTDIKAATSDIEPATTEAVTAPLTVVPQPSPLRRYPLRPLVGEVGFVVLRGIGFAVIVFAFVPLSLGDLPRVISLFSLAWLAGLVIPGAPGGLGVFEAIAVTLFQGWLSAGIMLTVVALYRLISTLAEALGAGLASLDASLSGWYRLPKPQGIATDVNSHPVTTTSPLPPTPPPETSSQYRDG